jgi:hypothetical protein
MCATLAMRAVERMTRLNGFREGLLAIVPRFANAPLTDAGLEHYARVMTYNGLTGMFLAWASDELRAAHAVTPRPLPLDAGGSFVDPDRSRLAVVRRGRMWLAVHAVGPRAGGDIRDDFGLLALKLRRRHRWVDVLSPRPFAEGFTLDSAGPALVTPAGPAFPHGRSFAVEAASGEIVVHGGYRYADGDWALRGAQFRYRPLERGVAISALAPAGSSLRFQDFMPERWTEVLDGGRLLRTPTAASRLSDAPWTVERSLPRPSGYSVELIGFGRYVTVPPSGRVSWTITARRLGIAAPPASGRG